MPRWGDYRSPAYGDFTNYYLASKQERVRCRSVVLLFVSSADGCNPGAVAAVLQTADAELRRMWGTPVSERDVAKVFVNYLEGSIAQACLHR
jgi:hypothetical protein